jgi:hypothetical protein
MPKPPTQIYNHSNNNNRLQDGIKASRLPGAEAQPLGFSIRNGEWTVPRQQDGTKAHKSACKLIKHNTKFIKPIKMIITLIQI